MTIPIEHPQRKETSNVPDRQIQLVLASPAYGMKRFVLDLLVSYDLPLKKKFWNECQCIVHRSRASVGS
jgi:hypothetical protein